MFKCHSEEEIKQTSEGDEGRKLGEREVGKGNRGIRCGESEEGLEERTDIFRGAPMI